MFDCQQYSNQESGGLEQHLVKTAEQVMSF